MKIVIIDDWISNALMIRGCLKSLDVEAEIFTSPVQALYWCSRNDPDLVMIDYQMPQMDAVEFLGQFRIDDRLRTVPVLVITWDETPATKLRVLKAGASDVLRKPINRRELVARVQNALELRASQSEFTNKGEFSYTTG